MQFNDHTVLITGGNTGIGREIALSFGAKQANVVINYLFEEEKALELVEEIKGLGGDAIAVKADVTDLAACENLIKEAISKFGHVDTLINNSGITKDNLILRMKESDFDAVIAVNLKGTWNMCKAIVKSFMKRKQGNIINISSVVGITGNPGQSNYVASKAGINGLTKTLAQELGSRNIRVNAIAPGFIETKMTDELSEEVKEAYLSKIPLRRFGKPEDIAKACLFLSSDLANYYTGQILSVNGGMV